MAVTDANGHKIPEALTPANKDSFAYPTIKDRVPIIICKVIDLLHRQRLQLALKDNNALKQVLELMVRPHNDSSHFVSSTASSSKGNFFLK